MFEMIKILIIIIYHGIIPTEFLTELNNLKRFLGKYIIWANKYNKSNNAKHEYEKRKCFHPPDSKL